MKEVEREDYGWMNTKRGLWKEPGVDTHGVDRQRTNVRDVKIDPSGYMYVRF